LCLALGIVLAPDLAVADRLRRASELFGLRPVEAALGYYAEYTAEIDQRIEANTAAAAGAEAL
jgi:hypothetical protein